MIEVEDDSSQLLALHWLDGACWTVRQQQQLRTLYKDEQCQSQLQLDQPSTLVYPHLRWLADVTQQQIATTGLLIGLGGGDWLRYCNATRPQQHWLAVDNQALLLQWGCQFFGLNAEHCVQADALEFLQQCHTPCEQIFIDLYPWPANWQLLLQRAMQLRAKAGWLAVNITAEQPSVVLQWLAEQGFVGHWDQATGFKNCIWYSG
jgi:hypothetical protein